MAKPDISGALKKLGPSAGKMVSELGPELLPVLESLMQSGGAGIGRQPSQFKRQAVAGGLETIVGGEGRSIDKIQTALDVVGVFDPTPAADAVNLGISLVRASKADTPEEKKYHLQNALISGISMVPYIGDAAKLTKLGRGGFKGAAKAEAKAGTRAAEVSPDIVSPSMPVSTDALPTAPSPSSASPDIANDGSTVRFYHGGAEPDGGPRWVTPELAYAEGYAEKSGGEVYYVDIPSDSKLLRKAYDDTGASSPAPFINFEAPSSVASALKKYIPTPANLAPTPGPAPSSPPPSGSPPGGSVPPPPPTGSPLSGSPPIPPSPRPGPAPPPPPPPVPPRSTAPWQSLLPLGVGIAAGAATSYMMGGGNDPTQKLGKRYSLSDEIVGPAKKQIFDDMKHFGSRGAEMMKIVLDPLETPIKKITTGFKGLADTITELPGALRSWGDSLVESQRHLRDYNGSIAYAFSESERREMLRNVESGARTGGSTASLSEALSDLKDEIQWHKDIMTNGFNGVVTVLTQLLVAALKTADAAERVAEQVPIIGPILQTWRRLLDQQKPVNTPAQDLLDYMNNMPPTRINQPPRRP